MRFLLKNFFTILIWIFSSLAMAEGYSGADLYFGMSALESSSTKNPVAYKFILSCKEKNCFLKFQEIGNCEYKSNQKHKVMSFDDEQFSTNEDSLKITQKSTNSLLVQFENKSLPYNKVFNLLVQLEQPYPDDDRRYVKQLEGSVSYKTFQSIDKKVEELKLVKEYALKRDCPIYLY